MGGVLSTRLPEELSERLSGYSFSRHPWFESKAEIYVLKHISEPTLYLKIRRDSRLLETEYNMLKWINHRIPTPDPHYYSRDESYEYLLTSEVTGTPTYQVKPHDRETAVRILAETLKQIHSIDVSGCPVIHSIENWVKTLEVNGIDVSSLEEWSPVENLVFTHGDYCLPNLLIEDGVLSGVIDWDFAGLADPYVDFVSCMWSIRYNFGEEANSLIPLFLETYDVELDPAKYGFYKRLNELIP